MSNENYGQFRQALAGVDAAILPNLSRLLDDVLDSASLARPGVDAEAYATRLRASARQLEQLTKLVEAVTPFTQRPERNIPA